MHYHHFFLAEIVLFSVFAGWSLMAGLRFLVRPFSSSFLFSYPSSFLDWELFLDFRFILLVVEDFMSMVFSMVLQIFRLLQILSSSFFMLKCFMVSPF